MPIANSRAELRAWNARMDDLLAKAEAQKAAGKIDYYEKLEQLRAQRDSLRDKLDALRDTGGDAWDDMKDDAGVNGAASRRCRRQREVPGSGSATLIGE